MRRLFHALDLDDVRWLCIIVLISALVIEHREIEQLRTRAQDDELAAQELDTKVRALSRPDPVWDSHLRPVPIWAWCDLCHEHVLVIGP